jgi:hypothetical protein
VEVEVEEEAEVDFLDALKIEDIDNIEVDNTYK